MRTIPINSFDDFVKEFGHPMWEGERMYRGVSDEGFALIPSIGRLTQYDEDMISGPGGYERSVIDEFIRRSRPLIRDVPTNEWDWLFLAQHHGLPTRLLDWTTNPLVALYFATEQNPERNGAIYAGLFPRVYQNVHGEMIYNSLVSSDPDALIPPGFTNAEISFPSPYDTDGVYSVYPTHVHQRYTNQSGFFTVQPSPFEPITDDVSVKYIVDRGAKLQIKTILEAFGIDRFFLFPTLDELARDIRRRWDNLN